VIPSARGPPGWSWNCNSRICSVLVATVPRGSTGNLPQKLKFFHVVSVSRTVIICRVYKNICFQSPVREKSGEMRNVEVFYSFIQKAKYLILYASLALMFVFCCHKPITSLVFHHTDNLSVFFKYLTHRKVFEIKKILASI
jgi:hypothetical protein